MLIIQTQDEEVGDGTTSVAVLASELLKEAEILIGMKIHPQTIISGYRAAITIAHDALEKSAFSDVAENELFKQDPSKPGPNDTFV